MNYHGVNDITKWRVNTVDAASVTDNSCKFDPNPANGEYTLEFGVDSCGNAESMSNDHKIWTAVIDNKDSNAGIYTSQKISEPFSCKYNKGEQSYTIYDIRHIGYSLSYRLSHIVFF